MALDPVDLQAAIEAVIFVASEPITRKRLGDNFKDEDDEAVDAALTALAETYVGEARGLTLHQVAGGYRIATRSAVHHHVQRYVNRERAERLSLRTLETLSVIAYKQPVTAAEIQEIRGVDPGGTLRTLLDKALVKVAGRKKVVGRPFVYATTVEFLKTFGLDDLTELPSLRELEDFASELSTTDPGDVEIEPMADESEIEELDEEGGEALSEHPHIDESDPTGGTDEDLQEDERDSTSEDEDDADGSEEGIPEED